MDKKNNYLIGLCILFGILKLISISTTTFNLYGDEAQYWLWSKDLSFGYYSKPPLFSWLISLVSFFFGDSFFVLKTIPLVLYYITSYLIFIFAKKLFNNFALAICCAITFFLLPSVSLSSFLLSTDCLLIFFWTWGLIQVLKIKENPSYINFIMLGFVVGFAFLTKYAAIYFIISLIFLIIIAKDFRLLFFKSKTKLLISFLILMLVLLPNIMWNYQNDWLTLDHTAKNASLGKIQFNLLGFGGFLISQVIMVGPILVAGYIFCLLKKYKIDFKQKFLISFALPALIIVSIESLLVRAHANWAAVSLVTLSIFFVSALYNLNKKIVYINNYFNLLIGVALFIMIGASLPFAVFNRINGLNDFVIFLEKNNINKTKNIVVSDRLLFANLSYKYYTKNINLYSPLAPGSKVVNHFQLQNPLPINFSEDFLLIGEKDEINYLIKNIQINLIDLELFPFSKKNIEIYEVNFK